jgi:serine O-acetyltransferase
MTDRIAALAARLAVDAQPCRAAPGLPTRQDVDDLCRVLLRICFPGHAEALPVGDLVAALDADLRRLDVLIRRAAVAAGVAVATGAGGSAAADDLAAAALDELRTVCGLLATDVDAAYANDPAAQDRATIILSYPCIEALAVQRFAHRLYRLGVPLLPRMMTEVAHRRTGIDIHPGAAIGESFFIDHGTGVVIGETSRLGRHCVLYQGVGLVAWNPLARDETGELARGHANKRHPDLDDHVTIYAGATILGGDTKIGHHSVIGGGAWVTRSMPPYTVATRKDPDTQLAIRSRRP